MPPQLVGLLRFAGLAAVLYALWQFLRLRASRGWRQVPGEILDSQLVLRASNRMGRPSRVTEARVRYRYVADGKTREGTRISVAGDLGTSTGGGPRAAVAEYPPGALVTVLVNPRNPDDVALNRNPAAAWFVLAVGVGFVVLPAIVAGL